MITLQSIFAITEFFIALIFGIAFIIFLFLDIKYILAKFILCLISLFGFVLTTILGILIITG